MKKNAERLKKETLDITNPALALNEARPNDKSGIRLMAASCFLTTFILLSLGAIGAEVTKIDIRFAIMVQDMAAHGIGIFPTIHGVEYADYPSGWVIASFLTSLGGRFVSLWTLALPAILCASWTVAAVCLIGERFRRGTGLLAAALLVVTPEFLRFFFGFGIDTPATAAVATMLLAFQNKTRAWISACLFTLLLAACFFTRGAMGIVLFGGAIAGFLIANRDWKGVLLYGFVGTAATTLCGFAYFQAVHAQGGEELWRWAMLCQFGSRMGANSNFLSYFVEGIPSLAPISLLALAVFLLPKKGWLRPPVAGWIGCALLPLLLLSVPSAKHLRYIAPTLSGFALMAACAWNGGLSPRLTDRWLPFSLKLLNRLALPCFLAAVAILVVLGCVLTDPSLLPWEHFVCAAAIMLCVPPFLRDAWKPFRPALIAATFFCVALNPFLATLESSERFVHEAESLRPRIIWLYEMGPDHDDLKYAYQLPPEERERIRLVYAKEKEMTGLYKKMYPLRTLSEAIGEIANDDIVIMRDREKERASFSKEAERLDKRLQVVRTGTLGHREFIAAKLTEAE